MSSRAPNKRPLKSLSDMLKGKQGRFRQNLLGKRVDYSGRSVIVVGPELKLHQCGLPKKMALELFKPFVYAKLELYGKAQTIKAAKRMVEKERPEVWDILEQVIREHPVLLNRAPTLHRLGIQAFEPVLIEGKAIQLHPLVCTAFNADFDGDQMAVHVPLSLEAQLEARVLMMSTNNILSPANGKPIIVPTQDVVLGLYYLSLMTDDEPGDGMVFGDVDEVHHALAAGSVTLHAKVRCRIHKTIHDGEIVQKIVETTPGRLLIYEILPQDPNVTFEGLVNRTLTKKEVSQLIDQVYRHCGQKETVIFADRMMQLGFGYACRAGISFGKDDMLIPASKWGLVRETQDLVKQYEQQYSDGLITRGEKYNKVVDAWQQCSDRVADEMMQAIQNAAPRQDRRRPLPAAQLDLDDGAQPRRGSPAQIRQLAGMRGLMAKPSGEIIENPIVSNFKEGLTVLEYFNSTHGARKGLADTALKTANSGYLTRRLVDVAQDCIITQEDCGSEEGIPITASPSTSAGAEALGERVLGRTTAEDVMDPRSGELIVARNTILDEEMVRGIDAAGVDFDQGPLRADLPGRDRRVRALLRARPRARHGGQHRRGGGRHRRPVDRRAGHAADDADLPHRRCRAGLGRAVADRGAVGGPGQACQPAGRARQRRPAGRARPQHGAARGRRGRPREAAAEAAERHPAPGPARRDGREGRGPGRVDLHTVPVITETNGTIVFQDMTEGISFREVLDESTGKTSKEVIDWRQSARRATCARRWCSRTTTATRSTCRPAARRATTCRWRRSSRSRTARRCTRATCWPACRRRRARPATSRAACRAWPSCSRPAGPRIPAIIADIDGRVEFGKDYKNKRRLRIIPGDEDLEPVEHLIPKGRHVMVQEGDIVKAGDPIVDGNPVPHDLLRVLGVELLARYLVNEIQEVYKLQGVRINDKHIEVIVRQMLQKIEILDPGDTPSWWASRSTGPSSTPSTSA